MSAWLVVLVHLFFFHTFYYLFLSLCLPVLLSVNVLFFMDVVFLTHVPFQQITVSLNFIITSG